eukprot:13926812-Alexandrium_andersonii.AAC.1
MSASLVGSEMCIRDRSSTVRWAGTGRRREARAEERTFRSFRRRKGDEGAVGMRSCSGACPGAGSVN